MGSHEADTRLYFGTDAGLEGADESGTRIRLLDGPILGLTISGARIACARGRNGCAVSSDLGHTWRIVELEGYDAVSVVFDPNDPSKLLAGTRPAAVFSSDDCGASWRLLKDFRSLPGTEHWEIPELDPRKAVTSVATGGGAAAWAVRIDPTRPQRFIVGVEVGGIVLSDDAGVSWRVSEVGDSPDPHDIALYPGDPDRLIVSTGYSRFTGEIGVFRYSPTGGVYVSTDAGRSFKNMWQDPGDPQYTRVMCCDPRAPYAVTVCIRSSYVQPNNPTGERRADLRQSRDGGLTWFSLAHGEFARFGEEYSAVAAAPSGAGDVYVATEKGRLFHVGAAKRVWRELPGAGKRIHCLAVAGIDTVPCIGHSAIVEVPA